jgi:hypothetical protein
MVGALNGLSRHAQQRRKLMKVTEHQIETVLADPDTVYPGGVSHPGPRTCYQRGELVVVVDDRTRQIVTVLFHGREGR